MGCEEVEVVEYDLMESGGKLGVREGLGVGGGPKFMIRVSGGMGGEALGLVVEPTAVIVGVRVVIVGGSFGDRVLRSAVRLKGIILLVEAGVEEV